MSILTTPITWTIAGSDSSAGAGLQADLKTMHGLGVYGCSIVTALTAQNTKSVQLVEAVSPAMLEAQLNALSNDLPPQAVKLGMLHSAENIRIVANNLSQLNCPIICDPVLVSTSGNSLMELDGIETLRTNILPLATLITPNIPEAHALLNRDTSHVNRHNELEFDAYIESLTNELLALGAKSVLLKGGHRKSNYSQDFFTDGTSSFWLTSSRQGTQNRHGTGCTLSAAIASSLALGFTLVDAIVLGKMYVNQGLTGSADALHASDEPSGRALPLMHGGFPESEANFPWLTKTAEEGRNRPVFPRHDTIGFYPIVSNAKLVEQLASYGVGTIQLRVKDKRGDALETEIVEAITAAKKYKCSLYINDYWQLAVKHKAFGVHLGQEDLNNADISAMQKAGLHLGVSTHCYYEVARALALQPSYMAIGPIFPTTTKEMRFAPQGLVGLQKWRKILSYPLVAIGGITLNDAKEALKAGTNGIAVVRDIVNAKDMAERAAQWLDLCNVR